MKEGESADGNSGTLSSAEDFSDEQLQELRDEAIRGETDEQQERQRELEAWKTTKGDQSNPWRYREEWDTDEPPEQKLGDHEALEGLSASEIRERIDAVGAENGHMNGNHEPKPATR